jgi:hypothetical protein
LRSVTRPPRTSVPVTTIAARIGSPRPAELTGSRGSGPGPLPEDRAG